MKIKNVLFLFVFAMSGAVCFGQDSTAASASVEERIDEVKGQVDGINETILDMKSTLDALKKIKISGYIQAQYQAADKDGAASVAGGNFPATAHERFLLRRGRVKFMYDNDLTQYVMQLDAVPSGVTIKDVYVMVKEPWMRAVSLTAGVFNRPFGFEIEYSSSMREAPERSRLFQTLFPGERDLGAKIEIAPESGAFSWLNVKLGLFNGTKNTLDETDNFKDVIGRVGFSLPFTETNLALDGGVSGYFGKVRTDDGKQIIKVNSATGYEVSTDPTADRTYIGGDLELYYDIPSFGGFSLRGEYISGKQPGAAGSSSYHAVGGGDTYLRNFMGYYVTYVQNIGTKNQFVIKYDVYDPNTDLSGDDIGLAANKSTAADIKYSTLGFGWIYHWDGNVKFTLYYDSVKNETSKNLSAFTDDLKDNVLTFRVQYSF
ncbi:MAG: porin [Ignavibacteria bacterium]|nr:porin [Ignavibacteria bacterium]